MTEQLVNKDKTIAASQFIKEKDYWTNKFAGELTLSYFPYDYPKRDAAENTFSTVNFTFDNDIFHRLEKLTTGSYPKLHMVLTAGLAALICKYTGNHDIIIAATIDKQEIEGEFTNTVLALRNQLPDTMTFKELLLQVRQTIIEALEHQNYPLEALLSRLSKNSSENNFQLFDIAVLLENIHDRGYLRGVKPNIAFYFLRKEKDIKGVLEYNSYLYEKAAIERIIKHFMHLLQTLLLKPDLPLSGISLLTEEEERQFIFDFNSTDTGYPGDKPIHALFEEQARRTPDHIAIMSQPHNLAYRELNEKSDQLAHALQKKGVKPDAIVGIMMNPSTVAVISILGILKAGGAYLPIDPGYPEERIDYMLQDSGAGILVSERSKASKVSRDCDVIDLNEIGKEVSRFPTQPLNHSTTQLCYVIYTSGTTGKPKGVMIEHRGLVNYIWWAAKTYVREEKLNFPFYTSLSFDLTITSIFTPLITGQAIFVYEGDNNELLIEQVIDNQSIGIVKLTPSHLKLIREKEPPPPHPGQGGHLPGGIKRFIVGGENLDTQLAKDVCMNFNDIEMYNEYGPTETVVGSMIYKFEPQKDKRKSVSIGVPIDNTKIYLLDRKKKPVPVGIAGEIYISGAGVARGYLNNPALTAETFIKNPFVEGQRMYRTGDLAVRLQDGTLEFTGRVDHQVKIRGFRIELAEIENQLLNHHQIKDAAVLAIVRPGGHGPVDVPPGTGYDGNGGQKHLSAYIVSSKEWAAPELREYLSKKLPRYMLPSYFVQLEKFPLTANGKVDKKTLESLNVEPDTGSDFAAPQNDIEKRIAAVWMEILQLDKVSIHENFFDLGGTSLDLVRANTRFKEVFNSEEDFISKILQYTTIRSLAQYLDREQDKEAVPDQTSERAAAFDKVSQKMVTQRNLRRGNGNV